VHLPEVGPEGMVFRHRVIGARPCSRAGNIDRIVQNWIRFYPLNYSPEEKQWRIDCEVGDANERNPKVRSVMLWTVACRCEHTYLFSPRINDHASKRF
jgi:hypothetical protein